MSSLFLVLILAIAPGVFWMLYFYSKDKLDPEPQHLVIRTFFIGAAAAIPIALAEFLVGGAAPLLSGAFMMAVVVAPIVEEYGKFYAVKITIYRHREFDEPLDGIIYGVAGALGFATIENILYIYSAAEQGGEALFWTSILRAFLSVPGHAIFGAMWGYAMGQARHMDQSRIRNAIMHEGVWIAIGLHALFNFLALSASVLGLLAAGGMIVLITFAWKAVYRRIDHAIRQSPHYYADTLFDSDDEDSPRPKLRL